MNIYSDITVVQKQILEQYIWKCLQILIFFGKPSMKAKTFSFDGRFHSWGNYEIIYKKKKSGEKLVVSLIILCHIDKER
jgi:hypothetical protein